MDDFFKSRALEYHSMGKAGKTATTPTKPIDTPQQLAMAYTPGVAAPAMEISQERWKAYRYTNKGNLVAVISNGSSLLGLGNKGALASKPVMEGKAVLFKRFADIDAVPLCISKVFKENGKTDPAKLIAVTECLEPSFGGINLEDIGAPACFEVEQTLKEKMNIPVFHDDQHGTAIISLAAILNATKLLGKKLEDCKFVVNGAGAAGISCSELYITAGAKRENFIMCDSKGVIHDGRTDLSKEKQRFAVKTDKRTLADALVGADVFLGLSVGNCLTKEMVKTMNVNPIIFAMANPTPEIFPTDAFEAGAAVVGTGRTDFPNQINNVLGFPGIFRGALDVRARNVNEEMKLAAAEALCEVASMQVDAETMEELKKAYPADAANGMFDGENPLKLSYVIPKPFDPRVVPHVARKVAEAAMKTNMAKLAIEDLDAYEKSVRERIKANR